MSCDGAGRVTLSGCLTGLALLFTTCTAQPPPPDDADALGDVAPPPPLFFAAVLPGDVTATVLAQTATATDLPTLPLILGGQGSWMVVLRVAADAPWANRLTMNLWLERDDEAYPLPPGQVYAYAKLTQLGPLWLTPELPTVVGEPCAVVGHVVHARAKVIGAGPEQMLDGRFRVSWGQNCP